MPSFNPLSTVISRRMRAGTDGLVTTGSPSAASVGASAAPTRRASQIPREGRSHCARPHPASTVNGSPIASSRTIRPRSWRMSRNGTAAASQNSTQTNVTSTTTLNDAMADGVSTMCRAANSPPTATNTTGAVRSSRSRRPDTTPHRNIVPARSRTAVVAMSIPPPGPLTAILRRAADRRLIWIGWRGRRAVLAVTSRAGWRCRPRG